MSEYEETKLKEFIINTIDPEKFEQKQSDIQPFECWLVEDDVEYASVDELNQGLATKQDTINDLSTIRSNASTGAGLAPQVAVNTQRIEDLTTAKFPNVVIVGTPHIEGGQVSNYSDSSYLQFPFVDISRGQPFDIYFSFTTSNDVTTQQNILDSYFGIALAIQNGKGIMALSSNGTNWDIGTSTGTNTLLPNTTYYVKYSWTGTAYSASLSTDDQTYVPDMNLTSSLSPHKTTIFIGGSPNLFGAGTAHPFKGTINFNKSKVVVGQNVVWEGMADVGLASRANVSLNNLDEVGEARFTNLKNQFISFLDSQNLTDEQKALAKQNIDASRITNRVINRTWTYENFDLYGTYGRTESWSMGTKEGLIVGDIFTINVTISDRNNAKGYIFIQISDLRPDTESSVYGVTLLSATSFVPDMTTKQDVIPDLSTIRDNASLVTNKMNKDYSDANYTPANINASNISAEGKSLIDSWGKPSTRYTDFTIGATGSVYRAPVNGYARFSYRVANSNDVVGLSGSNIVSAVRAAGANTLLHVTIPVRKGTTFMIEYSSTASATSANLFRFIHAEGEE